MKRNLTRQWVAALMVVASLLTALPVAAQKETKDIDEWNENTEFGKNGADMTADGYSLWDGHSFQNYSFNSDGDIEIRNAAQLARYAWDMYEAGSTRRNDRKRRNVHLLCDIDLGGYYFSILRNDYGMDRATFDGHGHTIRNGYAVKSGSYHALFSYIEGSTIRDLVVKDYHVKDSGAEYAGIVCGFARVNGFEFLVPGANAKTPDVAVRGMHRYGCIIEGVRVIDCTLTGDATYAGGILGWANGDALITKDERGGAIDHYFAPDKWKVQLCDNLVMNCTVSTTDNSAGGLVGSSEVLALYRNRVINTSIYGEDDYAGGLVGRSEEVINAVDNLVLNCNVSPFRAYFQSTDANGARAIATMFEGGIGFDDGSGPNAIEQIRTIDADGTQRVFDLSGRPLPSSNRIEPWRQKGIVIKNGRKVVR